MVDDYGIGGCGFKAGYAKVRDLQAEFLKRQLGK